MALLPQQAVDGLTVLDGDGCVLFAMYGEHPLCLRRPALGADLGYHLLHIDCLSVVDAFLVDLACGAAALYLKVAALLLHAAQLRGGEPLLDATRHVVPPRDVDDQRHVVMPAGIDEDVVASTRVASHSLHDDAFAPDEVDDGLHVVVDLVQIPAVRPLVMAVRLTASVEVEAHCVEGQPVEQRIDHMACAVSEIPMAEYDCLSG
mmetsp:Transcript_4450/g.10250  ORF Transcript_4450/g.10250 Transcript_4450/m.10250 type:complete len:205 (-) Transcript_4450:253-867(-)